MERAPLHETILLRNCDGATLTGYQGKVNKNVLLLSTLLAVINTRIIYRGVTGGKTSRHAFLRQLAEELWEVYQKWGQIGTLFSLRSLRPLR
jgi:hypothetical protein